MTSSPYVFRPMTAADLPLVLHWLQQPHVMQWWGDTHEQFGVLDALPLGRRCVRRHLV